MAKKKSKQKQKVVVFIVDMSGSMSSIAEETVSGINAYIDELKGKNEPTKFTLVVFNSHETIFLNTATPLAEVEPITTEYRPREYTPLLDAVGAAVAGTVEAVGDSTSDVLVMIVTDGLENRSTEYTHADIKRIVSEREAAGWTFGYMGANQDAFAVGSSIGVAKGNTVSYTTSDMAELFTSNSMGTQRFYGGARGASANLFSDPPESYGDGVVDWVKRESITSIPFGGAPDPLAWQKKETTAAKPTKRNKRVT